MAADGRRHIIAIGGGMLAPEGPVPVHLANALRLTGQREPRVCVLNTAGGDDPRWTLAMYDRLAGHPIRVSHLALFPMPNVRDPEDLLLSQDLIFVGGGSVANMVAVWRVHGLDVILRKAWRRIVLAGSSAGGSAGSRGVPRIRSGVSCGSLPTGSGCCPAATARTTTPSQAGGRCTTSYRGRHLPGGIACDDGQRRTSPTIRWPS